jgi:diguanylate cyclase (GGDEF)-like protein
MTTATHPLHQRPTTTPAVLGLYSIAIGLPYFLLPVYFFSQALAQPDVADVARPEAMTLFRNLFVVICAILGAQAIWLWWHRHDPAPRPLSSLCIVMLSVVGLVCSGIGTGSYNSPAVVTAILALVVGLALHPRRIVLHGFILSLVLLIGYHTLSRAGVVSYVPLFTAGTFVDGQPVDWWRHLRNFLIYVGLLQGLFLIFWLFARVDRQGGYLREMARSDILTGLADRAHFLAQLQAAIERRDRDGRSFTLLVCNLDWFRLMNDTYGHVAGDRVLRALGAILAEAHGPGDVAARMGGDEFAFLLADTDPGKVERLAEHIRLDLLGQDFRQGEKEFRVTMSMGIVNCAAGDSDTLLAAAQANLLQAKERGRNRVVASTCAGAGA